MDDFNMTESKKYLIFLAIISLIAGKTLPPTSSLLLVLVMFVVLYHKRIVKALGIDELFSCIADDASRRCWTYRRPATVSPHPSPQHHRR